jgi:hypothetical protein
MKTTSSPSLGRWDTFDEALFRYIVARVLEADQSSAVPFLQVNSIFHHAAASVLYEELYVQDDESVIALPSRNTRHETAHRVPKYAAYVRTLIIVPVQLDYHDSSESAGQNIQPSEPIKPESLDRLLRSLPQLEAFVW